MTVKSRPPVRRRRMYRLELACGHIAYAVAGEEHQVGRRRPCAACEDRWEPILTVECFTFGIPSTERPDHQ